jgi:hypothetical protein
MAGPGASPGAVISVRLPSTAMPPRPPLCYSLAIIIVVLHHGHAWGLSWAARSGTYSKRRVQGRQREPLRIGSPTPTISDVLVAFPTFFRVVNGGPGHDSVIPILYPLTLP